MNDPSPISFADDIATASVRRPPLSNDAEVAVLGGLMLDSQGFEQVADVLTADDFYRQDHQLIFDAIGALSNTGETVDAITVAERLEKNGQLGDVGGLAYVASLANDTPSAANIRAYADIVRERSQLRALLRVGGEIATLATTNDGRTATELVDDAERRVFEIAESGQRRGSGFQPLRNILPATLERIDKLYESDGDVTGVSSGFNDFDKLTSGLQPGDLIIIAGRPSMGKTSLAINIAENAAVKPVIQNRNDEAVPVAVFSMEMPAEQLTFRLISSLGQVNQGQLRNGSFGEESWPRITNAVKWMSAAPIFIDDTPALSPTEVRARARRVLREHGLGLIVIDYLQLMQVAGSTENRATEISEISRGLKALAKELNVPVIALSQLNRSVEQRQDKRPVMSDLRESGAIEQDADVIAFIYRDEVYNKETPKKGIAEVIIAKQRNGPTGDISLVFQGQYTRFQNYTPDRLDDAL
ncbi:MAG: replicative DNA helicase [Pseudomonadota bacterium]